MLSCEVQSANQIRLEEPLDTVTVIRVVAGVLFLCLLAAGIAYIVFLGKVLAKCSPSSRTMQPGMVWLLLVPLLHLILSFLVVSALADSLANEFSLRNIQAEDPKPGKTLGIAMAVCGVCSFIPFVVFGHLILWIVYWVKIADFSRRLDLSRLPVVMPAG